MDMICYTVRTSDNRNIVQKSRHCLCAVLLLLAQSLLFQPSSSQLLGRLSCRSLHGGLTQVSCDCSHLSSSLGICKSLLLRPPSALAERASDCRC